MPTIQPDVVLQGPRLVAWPLLLWKAMMTAGGALVIWHGGTIWVVAGSIIVAFEGLLILFIVALAIWPGSLELDSDGFTQVQLWLRQRDRWVECSGFRVQRRVGSAPMVVFNGPSHHRRVFLANATSRRAWAGGFLWDSYGLQAEELAELMNARRAAVVDG